MPQPEGPAGGDFEVPDQPASEGPGQPEQIQERVVGAGRAGAQDHRAARGQVGMSEPPLVPETRDPGVLTRLGLAIVHPRWALTLAGDRRTAGRSGSDMIA